MSDVEGLEICINAAFHDQNYHGKDNKRKRNEEDVEVAKEGNDADVQEDGEEEGEGEEKSCRGEETGLVAADVASHPERR